MWPNGPGPADSPAYGQHYPSGPSQPYSQQAPGEVVTIVRSGEAQNYYRGERGDYTAIVVAPSGEVEIRVVSR